MSKAKLVWYKDGKYQTYTNHWEEIGEGPTPEPVAVTGVSLSDHSASLGINETKVLTATITPSNATDKKVTWSSSDPAVASVNKGTVKGLANGTAIITVTTHDGNYTDSCEVQVSDGQHEVTAINIAGWGSEIRTITGNENRSSSYAVQVTPYTASNVHFTVTSSNEDVIQVGEPYYYDTPEEFAVGNFPVQFVGIGECTVTITSEDNPNATVTYPVVVTADVPVASISNPSTTNAVAYPGGQTNPILTFDYLPTNAVRPSEDIRFEYVSGVESAGYGWIDVTETPGVAKVVFYSPEGQVGDSAVFNLYVRDSEDAPIQVTVTLAEKINAITLSSQSISVEAGSTENLSFTYSPVTGDINSISVQYYDGTMADVSIVKDSDGNGHFAVTGISEGTTYATIYNSEMGVLGDFTINVTAHQSTPISSLSNLSASSVSVAEGGADSSITIDYLPVNADDDTNVEFVPVDDTIAEAFFSGLVQAGTATITVNGLAAGNTRISIYLNNVDTGLYIDVTVTAPAPTTYTVTATVNDGTMGSVSPTSVADVPSGTTIAIQNSDVVVGSFPTVLGTFVPTAETGYHFVEWQGITSPSQSVTEDMTITAVFAAD